jgi:hypothetical protein
MTIRLIVMEFGRFNLNSLKSVNDLLVPYSDRQLLKNCGKAFGPHRPATELTTTTISVLGVTRHNAGNAKIYRGSAATAGSLSADMKAGSVKYQSARARSWEQAEHIAQAEPDARDPLKRELQKIAEKRRRMKLLATRGTTVLMSPRSVEAGIKPQGSGRICVPGGEGPDSGGDHLLLDNVCPNDPY